VLQSDRCRLMCVKLQHMSAYQANYITAFCIYFNDFYSCSFSEMNCFDTLQERLTRVCAVGEKGSVKIVCLFVDKLKLKSYILTLHKYDRHLNIHFRKQVHCCVIITTSFIFPELLV